jgi:hypothetical protein
MEKGLNRVIYDPSRPAGQLQATPIGHTNSNPGSRFVAAMGGEAKWKGITRTRAAPRIQLMPPTFRRGLAVLAVGKGGWEGEEGDVVWAGRAERWLGEVRVDGE